MKKIISKERRIKMRIKKDHTKTLKTGEVL